MSQLYLLGWMQEAHQYVLSLVVPQGAASAQLGHVHTAKQVLQWSVTLRGLALETAKNDEGSRAERLPPHGAAAHAAKRTRSTARR